MEIERPRRCQPFHTAFALAPEGLETVVPQPDEDRSRAPGYEDRATAPAPPLFLEPKNN